jgi:hypothetical protein
MAAQRRALNNQKLLNHPGPRTTSDIRFVSVFFITYAAANEAARDRPIAQAPLLVAYSVSALIVLPISAYTASFAGTPAYSTR